MSRQSDPKDDINVLLSSMVAKVAPIETGNPNKKPPVRAAFRRSVIHTDSPGAYRIIRKLQQAFSQSPALRLQLAAPKTEEERKLSEEFSNRIQAMVGPYIFEHHFQELLQNGHVSIDRLKKMHQIDCFSDPDLDYFSFIEDLNQLSDVEKTLLLHHPEYFQRVLGFMNEASQAAARQALSR